MLGTRYASRDHRFDEETNTHTEQMTKTTKYDAITKNEWYEYVQHITDNTVEREDTDMIFETMDSSQDGRISKKEFALCIVSDLDTASGTTDTSPTSAYEALLITVLGIHTPSDSPYLKEDEECIFSTKCQFGKKPASTIDDSYSKMSGWHSHYSYPIHNRMSSSEETMDVTVSLVTRLGSRTRIGGYVKYHSQKKETTSRTHRFKHTTGTPQSPYL